jgi:uncharacterized protein (TIGR00299 family) protein
MGAAGDMLMAALLELHSNPKDFLNRLNNVSIPNVQITAKQTTKCGIKGTQIHIQCTGVSHTPHPHPHSNSHSNPHHHHNGHHHLNHLIDHLKITSAAKKNAQEVYKLLADAESHVHGVPIDKIHFHEIGELDAVADIVGVCMLIEELAPDLILASPVNVGSGSVRCAHGILPVPAPAAAHLLQNIPIYSDAEGELCTPTGAALLKHFVKEFCKMPAITIEKLGYGMGKKDYEKANCLRACFGTTAEGSEEVAELVCNLDDITPEEVAFAQQLLLSEGALDVYATPAAMKKGRSGLIFACLCPVAAKEKMLSLIFKHTSTLGIREYICRRYTLQREQSEMQTEFGTIRVKKAHGFGVTRTKPEYEDIAKAALENGKSIQEINQILTKKQFYP